MGQKKVGRPSSFRTEYCSALVEHMAKGFSFESFAATIGVHRDTLYAWAEEHEEFSDAKKKGQDRSLLFWENMGIAGAAGQLRRVSAEVEQTAPDGTVKRTKKFAPAQFSAGAWAFAMKNRFRWRDRVDVRAVDAREDDLADMSLDQLEAEADKIHSEIKRAIKKR